MPGEEPSGKPGLPDAEEMVARVQELVDNRPIGENCPIEWAVPAYYMGDMDALATLSLRSEITHP